MPKKLAIIALLLATSACGSADQTIDIVFDPCEPLTVSSESTASSDQKSIEDALQLWNDLAGTRLSFVGSDQGAVVIGFKSAAPAHRGLYDDEHGLIFVNRNLEAGRAVTITIAHEMGHAMGLVHVGGSERRSVMIPGNTDTPPGDTDREALISIWGECPPPE